MKALYLCALFIFSSSAALLPVQANALSTPIPLEDFAKKQQFVDIKISPNGSYLAATFRHETGNLYLTVISLKDQKVIATQDFKGNDTIAGFHWANDERILIEVARMNGPLEPPYYVGELFAMNADGSKPITLTGPRAKNKEFAFSSLAHLLPDEENFVLVSTSAYSANKPFLEIRRLNITNGRTSLVTKLRLKSQPGSPAHVVFDHNNIVRFAAGLSTDNDDDAVLMYRANEDADWKELGRTSATSRRAFIPYAFTQDNTKVIGLSNTETNTKAVSVLDLTTQQQTILAQHEHVDLAPIFSLKKGVPADLIGTYYSYTNNEIVIFDDAKDDLSNLIRQLKKTFSQQNILITSQTKDERLSVISISSENADQTFYIYDKTAKNLSPLVNSRSWLKPELMPKTQAITYQSRDGKTIHALLTLPLEVDAKDLPLVMMPHGGPHGIRDVLAFDPEAKVLASRGYAVLQPNFRGSGGFGLDFETAGHRNWGTSMINDMTDGVLHLAQKGIIDKQRVCSSGGSYGGYAALMSAIREPDLYKCVVGFVGVYDLNLMFTAGDIPKRASGRKYLEQVVGTDKEALNAQSPLHQLHQLKAPVFIIHGGADQRVPIIHATNLKTELEKRNHPYEWLVKETEGHGFYIPANNVERWEKMLNFFDKYIGAAKSN